MAELTSGSCLDYAERHEGHVCKIAGSDKLYYITGGTAHNAQELREFITGKYDWVHHSKIEIVPDIKSQGHMLKEIKDFLSDDANEKIMFDLYKEFFGKMVKRISRRKSFSKYFVKVS